MPLSPEVQKRLDALNQELQQDARSEEIRATRAYLFSQTLIFLALGCSAAAAIIGISFPAVSSRIVGGLAAGSPLLAFVGARVRLDLRESWYYRKSTGLNALRSRLVFQLPEEPTVEHIAGIAAARDRLVADMQREWDEGITKGAFARIARNEEGQSRRGRTPGSGPGAAVER